MTTVACSVGAPGSGNRPPSHAVRLDPDAFTVSSTLDLSMRVTVSATGMQAGDHSFWVECQREAMDLLNIPVAWTLTLDGPRRGGGCAALALAFGR